MTSTTILIGILFFIVVCLAVCLFAVISALKQLQETVKTQNKLYCLRFETIEGLQHLTVKTIKTITLN